MSGGEGLGLGSVVVAVQWQLVLVRCEIFTCDLNCKWFPIIRRSPPLPGLMAFNSLALPWEALLCSVVLGSGSWCPMFLPLLVCYFTILFVMVMGT